MEYQVPILKQNYKVLVRCFTFNQSKYIEDALNGFVMQKTNFPFICAIVDDCSTDGEQDVIKSYLNTEFNMESAESYETDYANIIVAVHKTNVNCSFAVFFLKYNHYSIKKTKSPYLQPIRDVCSYEAMCEGDDYWTYPLKLQTQVDFLDSHEDVVVSCHQYSFIYENDKTITTYPYKYFEQNPQEEFFLFNLKYNFFLNWKTKTLTCVIRIGKLDPDFCKNARYHRDVHVMYDLLRKGNGVCHSFLGGVYRKNQGGIFGSLNPIEQAKKNYEVYKEFVELEPTPFLKRLANEYKLRYKAKLSIFGKIRLKVHDSFYYLRTGRHLGDLPFLDNDKY